MEHVFRPCTVHWDLKLSWLSSVCKNLRRKARVNLRVQGGYGKLAETDLDFVRAFTIADKFGIDIPSGEALNAFRVALEEGRDTFDDVGTSHHVGWSAYGIAYDKERDLQRAGAEVGKVVDFAKELKQN